MQSYFNYDDAEIELDAALNGNPRERYFAIDFDRNEAGNMIRFLVLATLLVTFVFTLFLNLSSANAKFELRDEKMKVAHTFTIEIPEPEKPKIKEMPKQEKKEVPKPMDRRPPVRRRSAPQNYASRTVPEELQNRDMKQDINREHIEEKAVVRDMPAVETPVIEKSDLKVRENATEQIRYASAVIASDTVREYSYEGIVVRDAPTSEVSHSHLDPYHYNMVDLCLRLCAQSIFLREGGGIPEQKYSYSWLKIKKSGTENLLLFAHNGRWYEIEIITSKLKDLSDLGFVELPVDYISRYGSVSILLEDLTKRLCEILRHDDCLENL